MANSQNFIFGSLAMILAFIFVLPSVATSWPFGMISQGMSYMAVFFHEIGHTIFAWIYGIPAFPIFDFKHGGGYSVQIAERSWFAQIAIWGLSAYGLYNFKDRLHVFALYGLSIFFIFFGVIGLTDYYEDVILFMGHGLVAILGGFMLARGIYGVFLTRPSERWFNVFVGAFFIFDQIKMCHALLNDVAYQMEYESQKGTHGFGDLTRIANNHFPWTQDGVTIFLMVFTIIWAVLIPAGVGWLVRKYKG
jgi:hypothetical protein